MACALTGDKDAVTGVNYDDTTGLWTKVVEATQKVDDWQTAGGKPTIGGVKDVVAKTSGNNWTVTYNEKTATPTIG